MKRTIGPAGGDVHAQHLVAADYAVGVFCDTAFALAAFQVQFGYTARAARRLNSRLLPFEQCPQRICGGSSGELCRWAFEG